MLHPLLGRSPAIEGAKNNHVITFVKLIDATPAAVATMIHLIRVITDTPYSRFGTPSELVRTEP